MNALAEKLADDVERECSVLQFTLPDHDAALDKMTDVHRKNAALIEGNIASTRKALRKTLSALNAEIARLKRQMEVAREGATAKIERDEKMLSAIRAFLAEAE